MQLVSVEFNVRECSSFGSEHFLLCLTSKDLKDKAVGSRNSSRQALTTLNSVLATLYFSMSSSSTTPCPWAGEVIFDEAALRVICVM